MQAYDDAGRGLLILGAPGAGKSTLLRELASELLIRAEDDITQPVPVMVNLSSWTLKKPPLTAWMVNQLWETCNLPPRLSQTLIEQNQLLFLLDGLDEVESSTRTKCILAIGLIGGLAFRLPGGLVFALVLALALVLVGGLSGEQIFAS